MADQPMSSTEPRSFLDLPYELRQLVYHECLCMPDISIARHLTQSNQLSIYVLPHLPIAVALLRVCKKIHKEALPVLYGSNTFSAHRNLLTGMPYFMDPHKHITSSSVVSLIKRWYLYIRLDVDSRFSLEDATEAFTSAELLEVECGQAMFGASGIRELRRLEGIRNVKSATVRGSIDRLYANWLEKSMMTAIDESVEAWEDYQERRQREENDARSGLEEQLSPGENALRQTLSAEVAGIWNAWNYGNR